MSQVSKRVLHLIRHAQSEFNTFANHQIEGFFAGLTILDAQLTAHGRHQCQLLRQKIENDTSAKTNAFAVKNAQLVISSPLSRALHTAQLSMPMSKYKLRLFICVVVLLFCIFFAHFPQHFL